MQSVVKGLTAVGMSCLLLGNSYAQSWDKHNIVIQPDNWISFGYSLGRSLANRLDENSLKHHRIAFWHAVNNVETGQDTRWDNGFSVGVVRIVATHRVGDGHCRTAESLILHDGKSYNYVDSLCWSETTKRWSFSHKY